MRLEGNLALCCPNLAFTALGGDLDRLGEGTPEEWDAKVKDWFNERWQAESEELRRQFDTYDFLPFLASCLQAHKGETLEIIFGMAVRLAQFTSMLPPLLFSEIDLTLSLPADVSRFCMYVGKQIISAYSSKLDASETSHMGFIEYATRVAIYGSPPPGTIISVAAFQKLVKFLATKPEKEIARKCWRIILFGAKNCGLATVIPQTQALYPLIFVEIERNVDAGASSDAWKVFKDYMVSHGSCSLSPYCFCPLLNYSSLLYFAANASKFVVENNKMKLLLTGDYSSGPALPIIASGSRTHLSLFYAARVMLIKTWPSSFDFSRVLREIQRAARLEARAGDCVRRQQPNRICLACTRKKGLWRSYAIPL